MVRSSKCPLAVRTLEGLHSCVLAHVTSEFVRASKLPVAALPVTLVRFLPCVGPLVCLEVGALCVDLATAWVGAPMNTLVPLWFGIVVNSIDQLVRAVLGRHSSSRHHVVREILDGWARAGSRRAERVMVQRSGGKGWLGRACWCLVEGVGLCVHAADGSHSLTHWSGIRRWGQPSKVRKLTSCGWSHHMHLAIHRTCSTACASVDEWRGRVIGVVLQGRAPSRTRGRKLLLDLHQGGFLALGGACLGAVAILGLHWVWAQRCIADLIGKLNVTKYLVDIRSRAPIIIALTSKIAVHFIASLEGGRNESQAIWHDWYNTNYYCGSAFLPPHECGLPIPMNTINK